MNEPTAPFSSGFVLVRSNPRPALLLTVKGGTVRLLMAGMAAMGAAMVIGGALLGANRPDETSQLVLIGCVAFGALFVLIGLAGLRHGGPVFALTADGIVAHVALGEMFVPWSAVRDVRVDTVRVNGAKLDFVGVRYDPADPQLSISRSLRVARIGDGPELKIQGRILQAPMNDVAYVIARLHALPQLRRHIGDPGAVERINA